MSGRRRRRAAGRSPERGRMRKRWHRAHAPGRRPKSGVRRGAGRVEAMGRRAAPRRRLPAHPGASGPGHEPMSRTRPGAAQATGPAAHPLRRMTQRGQDFPRKGDAGASHPLHGPAPSGRGGNWRDRPDEHPWAARRRGRALRRAQGPRAGEPPTVPQPPRRLYQSRPGPVNRLGSVSGLCGPPFQRRQTPVRHRVAGASHSESPWPGE